MLEDLRSKEKVLCTCGENKRTTQQKKMHPLLKLLQDGADVNFVLHNEVFKSALRNIFSFHVTTLDARGHDYYAEL